MDRHEQYDRVFRHFDANGDGKISPDELVRCVASIGGDMTADEAAAAVAAADPGGDGSLSLEDFVRIVDGAGEEEKASDLKAAFAMYAPPPEGGGGGGGGGCITPKSLKRMLSRLGMRRSAEECTDMIARFDLNGDGVLCFDEFRAMMTAG